MTAFFRWSMRHGAAILFALAVLQFAMILIISFNTLWSTTSDMAARHGYFPGTSGLAFYIQVYVQAFVTALTSAAFPLFGAMVIHRIDRWLVTKDEEIAE